MEDAMAVEQAAARVRRTNAHHRMLAETAPVFGGYMQACEPPQEQQSDMSILLLLLLALCGQTNDRLLLLILLYLII